MSSPPPSPTSFVTYHLRPRPRPQSGRSTFDYRHRNRNTKQAVSHQAASQPSTSSSSSSTSSSSSSNNNNNTTTATTTTITDRHSPLLRFTQVDIFLQLSHTSLRCFRCFGAKIEEQLESKLLGSRLLSCVFICDHVLGLFVTLVFSSRSSRHVYII